MDPNPGIGGPASSVWQARFCPSCGRAASEGQRYCAGCGYPLHYAPVLTPSPAPPGADVLQRLAGPPAPQAQPGPEIQKPVQVSHAERNVAIAVLVVLLLVIAVFVVPWPDNFSGTFNTNGGTFELNITAGVLVTGSWAASSTQPVAMEILSSGGAKTYVSDGDAGSFSFSSTGGTYEFSAQSVASEQVSVSGSYPDTVVQWIQSH
jgi:hypothetical protein